ncbi:aspartate-semialdehyde dehydrogenase [Neorickettsia sennetsu]|uniref:Aspartate-semialdehyde dehydrogenase n=1 Tax=Ehrlichia sennetsu (strain ATCC VR-367 / Miyayama) TaxID=222891 RepID=Q2GEE3_EHRS3|nr:aspartate-semialdehyde dehydrogenase [Neorickettsia sennetsu]ABD46148.1 aspartate-semialdehyde dehydrogenase [Neorickettsia sennetsu str. Miyayama]
MSSHVAVVGATEIIGRELIKLLACMEMKKESISFLVSREHAGMHIGFGESGDVVVQDVSMYDFSKARLAFFVGGRGIAHNLAELATMAGCIVLDSSSCFRMRDDVPLVIPEVNPHVLNSLPDTKVISSPSSLTIQMLLPLKPLHDVAKISRIWVSTYQSVSDAGEAGMDELYESTKRRFAFAQEKPCVFPRNIEFNCIPQVGELDEQNFCDEEIGLVREARKILEDGSIDVFPTCVRVPVFVGHAQSITVEFKENISEDDVYEILSDAEGVAFLRKNYKCQPEVVGYDDVFVSRLRFHSPRMLSMWVVADNLRKGGALNLLHIYDLLSSVHGWK